MQDTEKTLDTEELIDASGIGTLQIFVAVLGTMVIFIDGFNIQVMAYITPQLANVWHIPHAILGPIFSSGLAGVMTGYLFLSPLSGRIGHRRMLIVCTAVFGILTLVTTAAGHAYALIILRFITGIALGAAMPSANIMIAEFCPKSRRSTFIIVGNCGVSLGSISAGLVSGLMLYHFGWRAVLWVGGVVPLLLSGVLALAMPESLNFLVNQKDDQRAALALARRVAPKSVIADGTRIISGNGGSPGGLPQLFHSGRTLGTLAIWFAFAANLMVYYFVQSWLTLIIIKFGHTQEIAITATSVLVAGGIFSIFLFGPLMDKLLPYKVMTCFFVVGGGAIALLGSLLAGSIPMIMVSAFCVGFVVLGIQKSMNAVAVYFYPTALRSVGLGWGLGIGRLGAVAGPLVAGVLMGQGWPSAVLFYWAALPMLIGAGSMLVLWQVYGSMGSGSEGHLRDAASPALTRDQKDVRKLRPLSS
jgi:AAHS family 4-hydroxybenzoate transporter-like MFS transporter